MDIITIIGLVLAWGSVIFCVAHEGGSPGDFWNIGAFVLVIGGTFGAAMTGFSMHALMQVPKLSARAFTGIKTKAKELITTMVDFSTKSRRDGVLALEDSIEGIKDPFMKEGMQLLVDGIDQERMRTILENHIATTKTWYKEGEEFYKQLGGFGPTLGIIGTVFGLIGMLGKLSDPGSMGPAIAAAFTATLYGVCTANLIFLPIGNKIKSVAAEDITLKKIFLEGLICIQSGASPRMTQQTMESFLHGAKDKEEPKK